MFLLFILLLYLLFKEYDYIIIGGGMVGCVFVFIFVLDCNVSIFFFEKGYECDNFFLCNLFFF